jgi:hypothetical protein
MAKATTVRFTDEMFARLDQASARTGMPVNSIVIAACLEWMQRHTPMAGGEAGAIHMTQFGKPITTVAPRWATLNRAVKMAIAKRTSPGMYPFERFTDHAKELLTVAQREAEQSGHSYIGTEHMLLACFGNAEFFSAKVLDHLGIEQATVRSAIEEAIGEWKPQLKKRIIPTSRVKIVIETAFQLSGSLGEDQVGTHHLLLALAVEREGIAGHVLKDLGATKDRIQTEVGQLVARES